MAGICEALILRLMAVTPILGICLGHQAIGEALGATVDYAKTLTHGKQSAVHIANGSPLFKGLPPLVQVGRYHSLAVRRDSLPDELLVIAEDAEGEVMGVKHKKYDLYGLQFHPESILTPDGSRIIENFLKIGGERA
jgi:anthranilate synthase component 2